MCKCTCNSCSNHLPQRSEILTQQSNWTSQRQPRSQGTLSTSRKYPGCGWSRVYVYKSNPHRGWIIDFILSTLSMEVKVVLLFFRSWKLKASCFRDPAWPVLQSFLSKLLWVWDVDWEGGIYVTIFLAASRLIISLYRSPLRGSLISAEKNLWDQGRESNDRQTCEWMNSMKTLLAKHWTYQTLDKCINAAVVSLLI